MNKENDIFNPLLNFKFYLYFIKIVGGYIMQVQLDNYRNISRNAVSKAETSHEILIVDDDSDDRFALHSFLKGICADTSFREFTDGEGLIDYLQCISTFWEEDQALHLPALIMLDVHMPTMDGIETLLELRGVPSWRDIPVILLTSTQSDRKLAQAYENGANAFLNKPLNKMDLWKAIRRSFNFTPSSMQ